MEDKTLGLRKIVGYVLLVIILYIGGKNLDSVACGMFGKYVFYGFFVFVGGNAIEYLKIIAEKLKTP